MATGQDFNELHAFDERVQRKIAGMAQDDALRELSRKWLLAGLPHEYSYHFRWLGVPIIQYPQDIVALQEIVWATRPDLIIETGIAHGGSLVFYASMLELMGGDGAVIGIDVDIREYTHARLEEHPMMKRITLIEGSSTDSGVLHAVREMAERKAKVMVVLDSNHTHEHVLRELTLYAPLVTVGNYLVVLDTVISEIPDEYHAGKPWTRARNPATAVREFLTTNPEFVLDKECAAKLAVTVAPEGYLRRVRE